jgi:hypothetical protein
MKFHILKLIENKNKLMGNLYDHGLPIFGSQFFLE